MGRNTQLSIEDENKDSWQFIRLIMDRNYFKDGEIIEKGKK